MAAGVWGLPGNMFFVIHSVPAWSPKHYRQRGSQICPAIGDTRQKAEITRCQITEGVKQTSLFTELKPPAFKLMIHYQRSLFSLKTAAAK